jgi:hypothetical protein
MQRDVPLPVKTPITVNIPFETASVVCLRSPKKL